jgi:hypothetical protein
MKGVKGFSQIIKKQWVFWLKPQNKNNLCPRAKATGLLILGLNTLPKKEKKNAVSF